MKHAFWAIFLLYLFPFSLLAQESYSVKGTVRDTAANADLINASVSILNLKDSTLVRFTRANPDGAFSIAGLKPGKFILLVTYPKYADFVESFSLDSSRRSVDFGKLNMTQKSKLLENVIIKGKVAAIKIKGDTTEYNAGSFTIEPNSKVEDLLRQLPGIQVDKDGKITAQGQTVTKVLVDGEEFFGDDPTLVTKNLRGDMIDKVQLYDKKSDQAAFTGIDDGEKTKTINLKLKEDKKKGYFGKVDGGSGNEEFYQGQAMFNAFQAKRKVAAYGTLSNTARVGLDREDSNKYGETTPEYTDEGHMVYSGGREDLQYHGQGIPSAGSGGVHYDAKWNKDKESINVNYKIGALTIDGARNNLAQTNLPQKDVLGNDSSVVFNTIGNQRFSNYTFRQKLDATYELKIDSGSNLKIVVDGTLKATKSDINDAGSYTRENNIQQNNSIRNTTNDGTQQYFFTSIFYNKKLKKKGRTFSVSLSQTINNKEDEGFLYSKNTYYDQMGVYDRDTIIDQLKVNTSESFKVNSNITYTEPITKTLSVVFNYGINSSKSSSDRYSFNKTPFDKYETLDTEFSNNFEYNQLSNRGGAVFNYKKDKTIVTFGAKIDRVGLEQIDLVNDRRFERKFVNINPQASYQYKFSQFKGLRINYYGNTNQPGINQIQPVRFNNDPLNIYLGNPDLKASFRNGFSLNYNSYKVLTEQSIYIGGDYSFVFNQVVNNTITDIATGASTHQSLNLTDKTSSNFSVYGHYSRKIKAIGVNVGLNVNAYGNTNFNYINSVLNTLRSNSYSGNLTIHKYAAKKYSFWGSFGPTYNTNRSTLQTRINNNGGGFRSNGSFTVYLPGKLEISSNFNYNLTKKTETFNEDVDYFIWNSTFSKKFLKSESIKLSLSGNDLLNQNIGFNRNAHGNTFSQDSYTTIKRYYMLSLLWDFNKMGGGLKSKD